MRKIAGFIFLILALIMIVGFLSFKYMGSSSITPSLIRTSTSTFPFFDNQGHYSVDSFGTIKRSNLLWFPVCERPYSESTKEDILKYFPDINDLDFDHYSYAVSLGMRIQDISTTNTQEESMGYKKLLGKAHLSFSEHADCAYLYRFPKYWIDIQWYDSFDGSYIIE